MAKYRNGDGRYAEESYGIDRREKMEAREDDLGGRKINHSGWYCCLVSKTRRSERSGKKRNQEQRRGGGERP